MFYVFGGESFYASGGASDLIFTTFNEQTAIDTAKQLIGKPVKIVEDYEDEDDDDLIEYPIEWTQVMDETGRIISAFGKPFAKEGNLEMKNINDIKLIRKE